MKMIKMVLLGGAAMAASAAAAQAENLDALKAQIESLNARVAAMEAAPSVPAGYQLLTISEGELKQTPGLEMSARDKFTYGNKATYISVLPTADAPAGTTITWSGQVRAGLVYSDTTGDLKIRFSDPDDAEGFADALDLNDEDDAYDSDLADPNGKYDASRDSDDADVYTQSRLRVVGMTDTAVGEVGVEMELRADFNGNGTGDAYWKTAWGYWAMTPELAFGGGYAGSLGNIGYGYDGACTCVWTDNADVGFDPGDTTQLRLTYTSGPLSMAMALEDGGTNDMFGEDNDADGEDNKLGVAGELKYTGDTVSGEISASWRDVDEDDYFDVESNWQVGAGVGFALGDMANLSLGAAMGEGSTTQFDEGDAVTSLPFNNEWWGVSALASFHLTDEVHAEIAGGYKSREGDSFKFVDELDVVWKSNGFEYETYAVMGGVYYTPVDQLTIGLEGEYYTTSGSLDLKSEADETLDVDVDTDTFIGSFAAVWRF